MTKMKDNASEQQLQDGEFRVNCDPDGFKRKMQRRSNWLRCGVPNLFFLVVIGLGLLIYFTAK